MADQSRLGVSRIDRFNLARLGRLIHPAAMISKMTPRPLAHWRGEWGGRGELMAILNRVSHNLVKVGVGYRVLGVEMQMKTAVKRLVAVSVIGLGGLLLVYRQTVLIGWLLMTKQCPACNLSGAQLFGVDLRGANLRSANLTRANLSEANLEGGDLSAATVRNADLSLANLTRANLADADLQMATLSGVSLIGANLQDANLHQASLLFADLQDANLSHVDLRQTQLYGANRLHTVLTGTLFPDRSPPPQTNDQRTLEFKP